MQSIKIRFKDFENAKALHAYIRDGLGFPDYYGCNLARWEGRDIEQIAYVVVRQRLMRGTANWTPVRVSFL